MARSASLAKSAPILLCALALSACTADNGRFPSLEHRPAERTFGAAQPAPADARPDLPPPPAADASLAARVAALRDRAGKASALFESKRPAAQRLVTAARGAPVASDAWSVAQVALAELDSARSQGMVAMSDLDRLLIEAAQKEAEGNSADFGVVQAAQAQVSQTMAAEDATLESLRSAVPD